MTPRRLYRCRSNRQVAGVAAGMAEYLDLDPTVVRIAWLLSIFLGGFTILLYFVLAFVIPVEPGEIAGHGSAATAPTWTAPAHEHRGRSGEPGGLSLAIGVLLVAFGGIALVGSALPGWVSGLHLGPAFVLALGIALVVASLRRSTPTAVAPEPGPRAETWAPAPTPPDTTSVADS